MTSLVYVVLTFSFAKIRRQKGRIRNL